MVIFYRPHIETYQMVIQMVMSCSKHCHCSFAVFIVCQDNLGIGCLAKRYGRCVVYYTSASQTKRSRVKSILTAWGMVLMCVHLI